MIELGQPIPPDTAHAVSVSLPTWKSNVGYEEGEKWVVDAMTTGYPRFFVHTTIQKLARSILDKYGKPSESALLFPSRAVASRCVSFLAARIPLSGAQQVRIIELVPSSQQVEQATVVSGVCAVSFPKEHAQTAKYFWQHTGEGVSSRRAEFCQRELDDGSLVQKASGGSSQSSSWLCKGPKRYQRGASGGMTKGKQDSTMHSNNGDEDPTQYIEERFGRNLDISFVANAKLAIRRRIAGSLTADVELEQALELARDAKRTRQVSGFSEDDVYLYPTGMNSIYNTHRTLLAVRGQMKSICFGFTYVDTLKVLQKFGPGCLLYPHGSSDELDDLERRLENGERFLAVFSEFPGNPLLKTPDLQRIRSLADRYDFAVVIDETIGNFINVHVLPFADVAVSSLTKIFSGDCNVMGGSSVLNPKSQYYKRLHKALETEYEDNFWAEDAIFMERNSRDFVTRIERINTNAEALCEILRSHPRVKEVYYPKYSPTRPNYDACRNVDGGYGGLLSVTFHTTEEAIAFYDTVETAKGPSLGTNFTLSSPYVVIAHYNELDWVASCGVQVDLVRISVGLEETADLTARFERALEATEKGVIAGVPFFDEVFKQLDCTVEWHVKEGQTIEPVKHCATVRGPVRKILLGERVALNTLARCSGVATKTSDLLHLLRSAGYKNTLAGTRKTTPGFRLVEKYGILVGGADPHRHDLSTMTMLKDNHIWSAGSITKAVAAARAAGGFSIKVEVECQSEAEAHEAIQAGADIVMLDNFEPKALHAAARGLKERWGRGTRAPLVEVSGGLTEENVAGYVCEDLNIISTSSIHQGVKHVDFSLKIAH
ncbi:MAG: hypothetical protein M1819_003081 [Sarea resinae]|nr:MAG: hypothetical protein M1819_003081 [Sarea resinae]